MRQLAPPSTLTASPTAHGPSTTSGSYGCATTWWISASMSIVGSQLARVDGTRDAADVNVRVEAPGGVLGDRTHGRRPAPRGEPGLPALDRLERLDRCEGAVVAESEQVGLFGADEHALRGRDRADELELAPSDLSECPSGSRRTIACRSATAHTPASPTASAETSRVVPKLGSGRGSPPATPNTPSFVPISSSDGVRGSLTQRPYRGLAQRRPGAYDASRWRWSVSRAMRAARPAIFCTTVKR